MCINCIYDILIDKLNSKKEDDRRWKIRLEFHEEDTIIACVGDNGGTTDEDIRNGFKRTVELLTESLKTGSEVEDLLVYPIVYNARHSIELSLKIVIKMLWRIEEKKGICYSEEVLKERKKRITHA